MKRLLLALVLVAAPSVAQITHPPRINATDLPTCDGTRDGTMVSIIDASSTTDCDNTGGGSITASCKCEQNPGSTFNWVAVGSGGGLSTDSVGTVELDDDANTPVAGDFVIVETGALSFDYRTPNAGTDVTADLEEEGVTCTDCIDLAKLDDDVGTPTAGDFLSVRAGATDVSYVTPNAGTDVTADLEEEAHASEHDENAADELFVENLGTACTSGQHFTSNGTGGVGCAAALGGGGAGVTGEVLHVRDEKAANTSGGTATTGSWETRTINTVATNTIPGASLASNEITLPAGRYRVSAHVPGYRVDRHKARLYNVTDAATECVGSSAWSWDAATAQTESFIWCVVDIAAQKSFRVEHRVEGTFATFGHGVESNFAVVEVYTEVWVERLSPFGTASTTDATQTTVVELPVPSGSTLGFSCSVAGHRTNGANEAAYYSFTGAADNQSGTTALVGTVSEIHAAEDVAGWNYSATADDTDDDVNIDVTGAAASNVDWTVRCIVTYT